MTLDAKIDKEYGLLTLVNGLAADHTFWALMSLYPSRYEEYEQLVTTVSEIDLNEFGRVVESGFGSKPSPAQLTEFTEKYGADYRFLN